MKMFQLLSQFPIRLSTSRHGETLIYTPKYNEHSSDKRFLARLEYMKTLVFIATTVKSLIILLENFTLRDFFLTLQYFPAFNYNEISRKHSVKTWY